MYIFAIVYIHFPFHASRTLQIKFVCHPINFFFFSLALSKIMARPRPWKKRHRHFEIETTRDSSRQFETIRDNNDNSGTNIVGQGTFLNIHFTL